MLIQTAPFWQGAVSQRSEGISQLVPSQPMGQEQKYPLLWDSKQTPSLRQGLLLQAAGIPERWSVPDKSWVDEHYFTYWQMVMCSKDSIPCIYTCVFYQIVHWYFLVIMGQQLKRQLDGSLTTRSQKWCLRHRAILQTTAEAIFFKFKFDCNPSTCSQNIETSYFSYTCMTL